MKARLNSLPIGSILKSESNTYTILDVLGQGSFGITYLAEFKLLSSNEDSASILVAIKEFFMHEINGRNSELVTAGSKNGLFDYYKNKFHSESKNLANLNHPNIIKVIDAFEANNTFYYVMEYVDAGSLDKKIELYGKLEEQEALSCIRQIGSALTYMHNQGMLHLDVKPGNIMIRSNGDCILIDFGLSKLYDENGEPESSTTIGGGTPGYAPLEQINRDKDSGFPVTMDVYALAATLYKLLTGKRPPLPSHILNKGFPSQSLHKEDITDETINAIELAMRPKKNERPQSIEDFISLLPIFADIVSVELNTETEIVETSIEEEKSHLEKNAHPFPLNDISTLTEKISSQDSKIKESVKNEILENNTELKESINSSKVRSSFKDSGNTVSKKNSIPESTQNKKKLFESQNPGHEIISSIISNPALKTKYNQLKCYLRTYKKYVLSALVVLVGLLFFYCCQDSHRGHKWVDLGLPSGTKWATCNVGASSPENYGSYFAWGETDRKKNYSWRSLKYCTHSKGKKFSKYVTNDIYGKIDNRNVLDFSDDAATKNWGDGWRTPTIDQINELKKECKWTWKTMNGHKGYSITGPNGNTIFLPAAGFKLEDHSDAIKEEGNYWSRTLPTSINESSYILYFDSKNVIQDSRFADRYLGHTVRPVLDNK